MSDSVIARQIILFNSSPVETLKGEPKYVRTYRLNGQAGGVNRSTYLQEVMEFGRGQKLLERCVYHENGSLYFRQLYTYDSIGRLSQVKTLDASGVPSRIENKYLTPDGIEVSEALDKDGGEVERTTTKRDSEGRILEFISIDVAGLSENKQTKVTAQYDEKGDIIRHSVLLKQNNGGSLLFETHHRAGQEELEIYQSSSEGSPMVRLTPPGASKSTTTERITQQDEKGNWIKKEIYGPGSLSQQSESINEISREITYY